MYNRVKQHEAVRAKRDRSLAPHVALVIVLAAALAIPFAYMGRLMYRYQGFKQDLATSVAYAENHGLLPEGDATRFYSLIIDAGMGKPSAGIYEGQPARFEFGDGSFVELWEVAIDGNPENPGTLIRYTRADGDIFAYDTDKVECQVLLDMLGLG